MTKYKPTQKNSLAHPIVQAMNLAWQALADCKFEEAKRISMEVLQQFPTQPDALHLIGVMSYKTGLYSVAIDLISSAILGYSKYPPMHGNLALAQLANGDLKGAATSCRKALALNPVYADGHRVLGLILQKQGKFEEAVREFKRALTLGLDTEELRLSLIEAQEEQGGVKKALKQA